MEGVDQGLITIGNDISANFAGTCQFPVIRIQLLMKDEKTEDLGAPKFIIASQIDIHAFHAFINQVINFISRGKVGVAGIGQISPLSPVSHRLHIDADEC